jgi:hypothetical protein
MVRSCRRLRQRSRCIVRLLEFTSMRFERTHRRSTHALQRRRERARLQSTRPVGRVAELGSLGILKSHGNHRLHTPRLMDYEIAIVLDDTENRALGRKRAKKTGSSGNRVGRSWA